MDKILVKKLYKDYNNKIDSIIKKYGERDFFDKLKIII